MTQLLALQSGDTRKQSEDFIKELFSVISSALAEGEVVKVKGLGVFKTIVVEARKSVNVSTGEDHEIPAHRKVVFVASKELAAMVNEPFEMFETVEIGDDMTFEEEEAVDVLYREEDIPEVSESVENSIIDQEEAAPEPVDNAGESFAQPADQDDQDEDYTVYTVEDTDSDISDPADSAVYDECLDSEIKIISEEYCQPDTGNHEESQISGHDEHRRPSEPESEPQSELPDRDPDKGEGESESRMHIDYDDEDEYSTDKPKSRFGIGFIAGFLTAVIIGLVAYILLYGFCWPSENDHESATYVISEVASIPISDNAGEISAGPESEASEAAVRHNEAVGETEETTKTDAVPTAPSDGPVYDTITKTRYLTTMAKEYYGNYNLWPIIYEENKAFLGHPDRIRPGTRVVVPPLSKYGVDPNNPEDVAKAKRKGVEIYSRYK